MTTIRDLQREVHALAREKGWWDERTKAPVTVLACLALIHSEVSEAAECARDGDHVMRIVDGKPEGLVVELADTVIRIMDLCDALGLDLEEAIERKHAYNRTRPYRHGRGA